MQQQTEMFMRELQEYQEVNEQQSEPQTTSKMRAFMQKYYNEMKSNIGIDEKFGEDEE